MIRKVKRATFRDGLDTGKPPRSSNKLPFTETGELFRPRRTSDKRLAVATHLADSPWKQAQAFNTSPLSMTRVPSLPFCCEVPAVM